MWGKVCFSNWQICGGKAHSDYGLGDIIISDTLLTALRVKRSSDGAEWEIRTHDRPDREDHCVALSRTALAVNMTTAMQSECAARFSLTPEEIGDAVIRSLQDNFRSLQEQFRKESRLCVKDVCRRYGKSERTVYRWLERGILPRPIRFSGSLWRPQDLEAAEVSGRLPKPKG